jgi:hypothetical protein
VQQVPLVNKDKLVDKGHLVFRAIVVPWDLRVLTVRKVIRVLRQIRVQLDLLDLLGLAAQDPQELQA